MPSPSTSNPPIAPLLSAVADKARAADVFGEVTISNGTLSATAKSSGQPAEFRLLMDSGSLWVVMVTADRWLSQSIEADLMNTGDKLDELIEEELVNLGWDGFKPTFEHFRDEKKLYTFRTRLMPPLNLGGTISKDTIEKAGIALLAYEAAFRPLGDMEAGDDE